MKLSLNWILDHIVSFPKRISVEEIILGLNRTTAEVELAEKISLDKTAFQVVSIKKIEENKIEVVSKSNSKSYFLLPREIDFPDAHYLILNELGSPRWATLKDLGSHIDSLIPPVFGELSTVEYDDSIIEVDNKSITHRPDLWCHRGFARELAALFNLELKPIESLLQKTDIVYSPSQRALTGTLEVEIKDGCPIRRLAVCQMSDVTCRPSGSFMAARLARIGSRPINALVDCTNYVMFDIGQPMHAFDRAAFENNRLIVRNAQEQEKITLLSGAEYQLHQQDVVIADENPLSLVGIMGGIHSGIGPITKSIVIESVALPATTIRLAAARAKLRTESSARFEKTLDPNNPPLALARYIKLLQEEGISYNALSPIVVIGDQADTPVLSISHEVVEKRLGTKLEPAFVEDVLAKLGFLVTPQSDRSYKLIVPSWRATKDISRPEDIVEELGRFYGYDRIAPILPVRQMQPFSLKNSRIGRLLEDVSAYGLHMRQVFNYPFFDEEFIQRLNWKPSISIKAKNPMSLNLTRLVTSLVPHLLKNISANAAAEESVGFFEINKIWKQIDADVLEKKDVAYIWWSKEEYTFYQAKQALSQVADALGFVFNYRKAQEHELIDRPWYDLSQTAVVEINGMAVGLLGTLQHSFYASVLNGSVVAAELDYDVLVGTESKEYRYTPISRFPKTWFDISMLVPQQVQVEVLQDAIKQVDKRITQVELRDYFENPEWKNARSVTMRYTVRDFEKTLTTEEIDDIYSRVLETVKQFGVSIR